MQDFEITIIGGGPAGLSAALVLARACRSIAVLDAGTPRNQASPGVHGFLSRDGILPSELRKVSRKQIAGYPGVEFVDRAVQSVRLASPTDGIHVALAGGRTITTRLVIIAVGMVDVLPELSGFDQHWGNQIIHCPFCHGFENRGTHWGLLAKNLDDIQKAFDYGFWTEALTVFADRKLHVPEELLQELTRINVSVERRTVRELISSADGRLCAVEVENGVRVPCETLVYRPEQRQTALVNECGLALNESGRVWIDEQQRTSVPGIFAAGDLTPGCQDVLASAAEGADAAKHALDALRTGI